VLNETFEKWALDFVGPINPPSRQKTYILVCTYYIKKWVEVKSLPRAIEKAMIDFLHANIFIQFGVPREIVTEQGNRFTSKVIQSITNKYQV
jgi:hypothetical protein